MFELEHVDRIDDRIFLEINRSNFLIADFTGHRPGVYFEAGYALHAAPWHDEYGKPRSHGCINLSPIDARRVFMWTDPPVPSGWHGINIGTDMGQGTAVVVRE